LTVAAACRELAAERPAPLPGTTGSGAQQQGAAARRTTANMGS